MQQRCETRVKAIIPVKVWLAGSSVRTLLAYTLDISRHGARLEGLSEAFEAGDTVVVQHGPFRAHFRVCWSGKGRHGFAIGVASMNPERDIWGLQLPLPPVDMEARPAEGSPQ